MRIVYKLTSGAVLAVGETRDGDIIINPPATEVFPGYNPANHGNFAVNVGLPSDLIYKRNLYQVDDVVTPTTVIPKFHLEVTSSSSSMVADGVSKVTITIAVKNAGGGIEVVPKTVNLSVNSGFLSTYQVSVVGSTTVTLTSGLATVNAIVKAVDNDVDTTADSEPVFGLIEGESLPVSIVASPIFSSPLSSAWISPRVSKTGLVLFNDGEHFPVGIGNLTTLGVSEVDGTYGPSRCMTRFDSDVNAGDRAGLISSTFALIKGQSFSSLYFDVWAGAVGNQNEVLWLGMFGADPTNQTSPTNCFGFRAKKGVDTNWAAYYHDAGISMDADTGVPIYNGFPITLEIKLNPTTGMIEYYVNSIFKNSVLPTGPFAGNSYGLTAATWNLDVLGNAAAINVGLIELQYK